MSSQSEVHADVGFCILSERMETDVLFLSLTPQLLLEPITVISSMFLLPALPLPLCGALFRGSPVGTAGACGGGPGLGPPIHQTTSHLLNVC